MGRRVNGHGPTPRRRVRALAGAVAVLAVAGGLAACVPSPDAGIACGWPTRADRQTLNVAYPDTGATYFATEYQLYPGQTLTLAGTYPFARYLSLTTYTLTGNVVDQLTDTAIQPDAGSSNPFTDPSAPADPAQRRWTVSITPDVAPGAATNTLSAATFGSVILRVYVPDDPADPTGGVALPAMSVRDADGVVTPVPPCGSQGPDPKVEALLTLLGPATDQPPTDPPEFRRPLSTGGLYPNPDNTYLAAVAAHTPGEVVVVRATAPTTPDTRGGESPATPAQLRYWSLCTDEYRKPYPVTDCVFDHQVPVATDGTFTVVVSTPGDRPANATTADGVAWLDWGSTTTDQLLLFRNMLPAPSFTQSAFAVAPGQLATDVMGPYAPVATTCTTAAFEAAGAACAQPPQPPAS